jgi:hypothetical protein
MHCAVLGILFAISFFDFYISRITISKVIHSIFEREVETKLPLLREKCVTFEGSGEVLSCNFDVKL